MSGMSNGSSVTDFTQRNKKWKMELLMERLRSKSSQYKSLQETSKQIRMTMLEKRYGLDSVEKSNLQKCLDSMQYCIKVTTRQGLVERLESLSRQLGLKFMDDTGNLFISSDMFFLEIVLDPTGKVHDVKVHHECKIEQQSCSELVSCLLKGDFADFTIQLEGLTSIYQLNADTKIKSNAFVALQALETDLNGLYMMHQYQKDPYMLLNESPVGILEARRGGHPMRLTYFVPPYQLLDTDKNVMIPLTVELVHSKPNIGMSVTVHLEAASANKLQITSIMTVNTDQYGRLSPTYVSMNSKNSIMLPASFVLRLSKPMPVGINLLRQIEKITGIKFPDSLIAKPSPIMSLIVSHATDDIIKNGAKGLFVSLPDQTHCYYMTENLDLMGVVVKSISFTEPAHVPKILRLLKQQALFNTLICSCIRTSNNRTDIENMLMFEINALSCQHISVTLEHPYQETMAIVELELAGISDIKCSIYMFNSNYNSFAKKLSKVVQKCASIPVTLRTLIKHWDQENASSKGILDITNCSVQTGSSDKNSIKTEYTDSMHTDLENSANALNSMIGTNGSKSLYQPNTGIWANASDGENGTKNKNGTTTFSKHKIFDLNDVSYMQQAKSGNNMDINFISCDGKAGKRRRTEDFCKSPKREPTNSVDVVVEQSLDIHSSSDSSSLGVPTTLSRSLMNVSSDGVATSANTAIDNKRKGTNLSADSPTSDGKKATKSSKTYSECDRLGKNDESNSSRSSSHSEPAKKKARRRDEKILENSSNLSPSVSITPITSLPSTSSVTSSSSNINSVLTGLEKRPGIEIIPISSTPAQSIKSSITITPISSTSKSSSDKRSLSGSSSSTSKKSEDRSKVEKKKRRKRDETPMGPPEKMPLKQDPLTRPVTVSIKTSDGLSISPSGILKKFSTSPVHPPSSAKGSSTSSSSYTKPSPKHSPHSSNSFSPKHHTLTSPRPNHYSTTSPKHATATGSGKPSMSALKSATNSPNSKSSLSSISSERTKSYSSSSSGREREKDRDKERDRDRDKDKDRDRDRSLKYSSSSGSPKLKHSTVKLKHINLNATFIPTDGSMDASSSSQDSSKSLAGQGTKVRKGSLSAVIDKLKSAKTTNDESPPTTPTLPNSSDMNVPSVSSSSSSHREKSSGSSTSISSIKNNSNSEYMVKHSSDGMKITINKTRMKDSSMSSSKTHYHHSSSSSSGSGSNSPKTHTGLKPGVNSGPASKKPQNTVNPSSLSSSGGSTTITISSSSSSRAGSSSSSTKSLIGKSSSSGSLGSSYKQSSASSHNSVLHTSTSDSHKKEKNRSSSSSKSNIGGGCIDVMKMFGYQSSSQSIDNFLKSRDQKYQIPKLSARINIDNKDSSSVSDLNTKSGTSVLSNEKQSLNLNKAHDSNVMNLLGPTKMHTGRASSVSPKYTIPHDNNPAYNKDLQFYKSTSSDGMHHQNKHVSFSNPTTSSTSSISMSSYSTPIPYTHPSSGNNNSGSYASIIHKSPIHSSVLPKFLSNDISNMRQMQSSMIPPNSSGPSNKTLDSMLDYNASATARQNKNYQRKSPKTQSQFPSTSSESPQYITDDEVTDEFGRK